MRGRALPFVQRCCAGRDKWRRVRSELGWPAVGTLRGAVRGGGGGSSGRLFGRLALVMSEKSSYLRRSRGDCSAPRRGSSSLPHPLGEQCLA